MNKYIVLTNFTLCMYVPYLIERNFVNTHMNKLSESYDRLFIDSDLLSQQDCNWRSIYPCRSSWVIITECPIQGETSGYQEAKTVENEMFCQIDTLN